MGEVEWLEATYWDGERWLRDESEPWLPEAEAETTPLGLSTFRFRWVFRLRDGAKSATLPFEAKFYTVWADGGEYLPPGKTDVSDVTLQLVSIDSPG